MYTSFGGMYDKKLQRAPTCAHGLFERPKHSAAPFTEGPRYLDTQPPRTRKLGFGTKNANVRDEFISSVSKSIMWRTTTEKENRLRFLTSKKTGELAKTLRASGYRGDLRNLDRALATMASRDPGPALASTRSPSGRKITHFDRIRGEDRHTFKPRAKLMDRKRDRRYGLFKPSSASIGYRVQTAAVERPKHTVPNEMKTFWNTGHLNSTLR